MLTYVPKLWCHGYAGLSFKKGLAKLNASTDVDMLRCFTLPACNVTVAVKQLRKDRYIFLVA